MNIFSVITLIGGLAFFLFGMNVMSGSLEKMAGGKLELLLKKMTANPIISLVMGAVITIAIQSSSATTVMMVGLVNSGIMDFAQTLHIIFGANIGTTLTSWILSLSGIESDAVWMQMLKPENFAPLFAMVGIVMTMVCKSDKKRSIGTVLVGFAVLIFGMNLMGEAVSPLADSPAFAQLMTKFNQPLIGLAVGTVVTGIIQSSAASVGMLQALSLTGSISYAMAIPIIMGQNIGTCVTAMISSIGTNTQAKRVAVMHISVNVLGTLIWLPLLTLTNAIFHFAFMDWAVSPVTIAMLHSVFNILTTLVLMPFSKYLLKLAVWVVKEKGTAVPGEELDAVPFLDERLLSTPSVAIQECNSQTCKMLELARENIRLAVQQFSHYSDSDQLLVLQTEEEIDAFEDRLSTYLVKLSAQALSQNDSHVISKMLHAIGDFERLGDHAVNLNKVAKEIHDKGLSFTQEAQAELNTLLQAIDEILTMTVTAYERNDTDLAARVEPLEEVIDQLIAKMKDQHIRRLQQGACTIEKGFIFSDILNNCERISDHCSNIAVAVIEVEHDSFDAHRYLQGVKYGNHEFNLIFQEYAAKYAM
ncbi:MAG: Na/Pi cotransporter family protein [Oscillospiraceae bacterium]|jgi:phosphate:Na+ symporter